MRIKRIVFSIFIILIMVLAVLASLSDPLQKLPMLSNRPLPPLDELIPQGTRADTDVTLRILLGDGIEEISMERYVIGVVAAEMPATFELDALMAQAVAARTNALYNIYIKPKLNHPGADICTDYFCCAAYSNDEFLRDKWENAYVINITRVIDAVLSTDGEYISYEDEPILAVFHSSSAGKTETSGNVWLTDLPYLQSVDSPETEENVPDYISSVAIPGSVFSEKVKDVYPDAVFSGAEKSWIKDITHTESGRVKELVIGGVTIKGTQLRSMFDLRSTAVVFEWDQGNIVFTTTGYGHGVGMSQYGANVMAKGGIGYRDILSAYYTDTIIVSAES